MLAALIYQERNFISILTAGLLAAAFLHPYPQIAMWIGFSFAAYSAIANDSIQTIGTFLASNGHVRWQVLWLFIGGIFLATSIYSWVKFSGDVSYQRLTSRGFEEAPSSFKFIQLAAPLVLLVITRLRMPVSTTFLLLSVFAVTPEGISDMITKSLNGYVLAFAAGLLSYTLFHRLFNALLEGDPHPGWRAAQWFASGFLWSVWLMQDMANLAVFLPRKLELTQFLMFISVILGGLAILLWMRGDRIQEIITEKKNIIDVRAATFLDIIYGALLYYFKAVSNVPMSTTWVFIGLLAGRELGMALTDAPDKRRSMAFTIKLIGKDLLYATIGLTISLIMAAMVNDNIRNGILSWFGLGSS